MRYSREIRRMIYFEAYGFNPVVYAGRRYIACDGLILSSFRPVKVLIPYDIYEYLRKARVKKYVAIKSTSNKRITISTRDIVVSIYDRKRLKQITNKESTIPERIDMRLRTTSRDSEMYFVPWNEIPSFLLSTGKKMILLALYYVRSSLGMKMFKFDNYSSIEKLAKKLRYIEGLLINHREAFVYVPRPERYIHYNDVRRALISLRYPLAEVNAEMHSYEELEEEESTYEDEEEELPI